MAVKPIPDGYLGAIPYLCIDGAAEAIELYKKAFGATELMRMPGPDGRIGHAEIKIGDCVVMLADEHPEMNVYSPKKYGGSPVQMVLYVPNVDALAKQAEAAGVKTMRPLANQFYGDRSVTVQDKFGHTWTFSTHVEDVQPDEMMRRAEAMQKQQPATANA